MDLQARLAAVDVDRPFGADHFHAGVDLVGRALGQVPDRLDHGDRAVVQPGHGPAAVGILVRARVDLLGIDAHRLGLAEPEHQVAVVDAVAHQGRDAVQHLAADRLRQVAAARAWR